MQTAQNLPPLMDLQSPIAVEAQAQSIPDVPSNTSQAKPKSQPQSKGKSKLPFILLSILLVIVLALVALWFNLATIIKSQNAIVKEAKYTMLSESEFKEFDLAQSLYLNTPRVEESFVMDLSIIDADLLGYYLQNNPKLSRLTAVKIQQDKMLIQVQASDLLNIADGKGLALPISAESLKDVFMNIEVKIDNSGKKFNVTNSTLGSSLLDSFIPANFNQGVTDYLNSVLATLSPSMVQIKFMNDEIFLVSPVSKFDVSKAATLKGTTVSSNFDLNTLATVENDDDTEDYYFNAKQWLEFTLAEDPQKTEKASYTYMEILGEQLVYYVDMSKLEGLESEILNDILVEYDSFQDQYYKVTLSVNESKTGFVVDSVSLGNKVLDNYYTKDLLNRAKDEFELLTFESSNLQEIQISNGKLKMRLKS